MRGHARVSRDDADQDHLQEERAPAVAGAWPLALAALEDGRTLLHERGHGFAEVVGE
jgi:hypothetical protein